MARRFDDRSEEAREYRRWYNTARWKKRRAEQLRREPLCRMCWARGITTAASIADHVIPHRGDPLEFWFGELQSLGKECGCHDVLKQQIENRGYHGACDVEGWPVDRGHPANRRH